MATRLQIDPDALLTRVPELDGVRSGNCKWNELGEMLYRKPIAQRRFLRVIDEESMTEKPDAHAQWVTAKQLVHSVLPADDHPRGAIPSRFSNLSKASTPIILTDLSLWLAGEMKISVTVTRPMVAAMLYGIHEASGDAEILRVS